MPDGQRFPLGVLQLDGLRTDQGDPGGTGPDGVCADSGGIPVPGLRKGCPWDPYAAPAHGDPYEWEEDPAAHAEISPVLPHPEAEPLPQITEVHPDGQRGRESGELGVRVPRAQGRAADRHHLHPLERSVLLPVHDPGCLHEAGAGVCYERIAGGGFRPGDGGADGEAARDLAEQGDCDPQRPGGTLHQFEVHPAGGEPGAVPVHVPPGKLLGQCATGELLRAHEGRAGGRNAGLDIFRGGEGLC